MDSDLARVIWDELKPYINTVDRVDAAENMINILIDNDCSPDDIKDAFRGDSDFKKALAAYLVDNVDEEEYDDDSDYEDYED